MRRNDLTRRQIIRNFINDAISIDALGDDENLFECGILNSLFAVQLMTFLEQKFGIEIEGDDLELDNFKSIAATADFVERKSGKQDSAWAAIAEK